MAPINDPAPGASYSEDDWNEAALKDVEEKGAQAGVGVIYSASKVLAERGTSNLLFLTSKLT